MYDTSKNYKIYIKEPSRMFESKIVLGERTFKNDDVIQLNIETQQPNSGFSIGSTISKSIELTLKNDRETYASVGIIDISLGLKIGEAIEYIKQGIFNIDVVTKTDYTVKITAYDNMIKFEMPYSEKYSNPTLNQVIQQLQSITGVEFDSSVSIPNYTLSKLSGYTCREILGYVASLMGGNAYITRNGKFTIVTPIEVDYTVTSNNYWDYDIEDNTYKIGMLTCQNKVKNDAVDESDDYEAIKEKNTISVGSLGTDNMELTFVNPWMTETILNSIYNKLKDFSFLGYSVKWQGDLSVDIGDIINVIDKHGIARKAFVFSDKIRYNGGLTQETSAKGQTKSSNKFSTTDSPTEMDRISVKLLLAEKAIIQKANISDLTAVSAKVGDLQVSVATINTALMNYATIDNLNATNIAVNNLVADYSQLSNALINKAEISDLNAATADISKLNSNIADINTLLAGNLTSANIHSLVLTADKVTVDNGFIKNAMIDSLTADKISAGIINTNNVRITSTNGGMLISGPTQQFKDKNDKVRLQIGQDAEGNFNFILVGEDGKSVLLDTNGIHEGAISDGLIKTDMLDGQAVTSDKVNYESFVKGLNEDTNTNYIDSSKVNIDLLGQTLDIAFNSLKTTVDNLESSTDITTIKVMQGQISTLISNTTIDKSGETIQLKDAYSSLEQLVNSISFVIGNHESYLNPDTGEAETVISSLTSIRADLKGVKLSVSSNTETLTSTSTKVSELESTLDGFKTLIEQYERNVTELQTDISNYKTEINQSIDSIRQTISGTTEKITEIETNINSSLTSIDSSLNGITAKVTTMESTIDNFKVGTRNYIVASDFNKALWKDYWKLSDGYGVYPYEKNYYYYHQALLCINDTNNWINANQCIDSLDADTKYSFSFMAKGRCDVTIGEVIYDRDRNNNSYVDHTIEVDCEDWTKFSTNFTTDINLRYAYVVISTKRHKTSGVTLLKLEQGNILTDWTPAPEDSDYITTGVVESVKETNTQISLLKDSISLAVTQTEFSDTIDTINTSIKLQAGLIENKVEKNDVGTIISQSPTEVMTAFNGISQYFEVSANGAKFGNISTGDYTAFNDRGLVRYIANQERRYIYMVQQRIFEKTLNNQTPSLTTAQQNVGKTYNWDDIYNNMPKAKDYAQTFTLNFDDELIDILAGYIPNNSVPLSSNVGNPSNLSYSGLSSGSQEGVVGEDYIYNVYIKVLSMTSTSITFEAARICCVYEVTVDKTGLIKYYQYKRNYAGGKMTWNGLLFA